MRAYVLLVFSLSLEGCDVASAMETEQPIPLPAAELVGEMSVELALKERRSIREFSRKSLALEDISQLLWAAQGITGRRGFRAAPSAGALYPLELYVIAGDVDGLAQGIYRYRPRTHDLLLIANGDLRKLLAEAALDQSWLRRAPATLVITGIYQRTMDKYGQRGRRYVHMEVGHAAQNVYLQATSRGLGTVMVGAFRDQEVSKTLNLPGDHKPLGLMPIGYER